MTILMFPLPLKPGRQYGPAAVILLRPRLADGQTPRTHAPAREGAPPPDDEDALLDFSHDYTIAADSNSEPGMTPCSESYP